MRKLAMRVGWLFFAAAVLAAGSGCVAFNVGKPEVYTHTETVITTNEMPIRTEVLSVEAKAQTETEGIGLSANRLNAWLDADVREEFQRWQHEETATLKKQKRMAVGLYPEWATLLFVPKGALDHALWVTKRGFVRDGANDYERYSNRRRLKGEGVVLYSPPTGKKLLLVAWPFLQVFSLGSSALFGTVDTLFVEPFSNRGWKESVEVLDVEGGRKIDIRTALGEATVFDVSASPKMKAFTEFSAHEREQMGILTCFDMDLAGRLDEPDTYGVTDLPHVIHLSRLSGILGISKYYDVFTEPVLVGSVRPMENGTVRETRAVGGPYEVELWVPGTGISLKASVGAGDSKATFDLPKVERGGAYEATLEFRSLYAGTEDAVRKAWQTRTLKKTVWLAEKPKPQPVVAYTPPPPQAPVPEVVKEVHHYHETRVEVERKPEGPPYDVEKMVDGAGRTVWQVKILAENLNAFAVDAEVKPRILRELQDDFAGRNREVPRGEINAFASYTTEDRGRTLVYVGVAESLIPKLESLTYSAETHRGTVTMRLAGGADLRHAKEFVRANISAIVCDKNVVLTAGERPPDGATYQYLDENFADGVLTVEFEAEK